LKENDKLESRSARHLADMTDMKHNSGFTLKYMDSHICEFDSFCVRRFPEKDTLDYELVEEWVHSSPTKSSQEIEKRYRTMKHLGEYMLSQGFFAYISTVRIRRLKPAEPYILTDEQMSCFFHACDGYPKLTFPEYRHIVVPVLFRTIYCCGLRNSEACDMKRSAVDLKNGAIRIEHSKGAKDRIVYMSAGLSRMCARYDAEMDLFLPDREYFFPSEHDKHFRNSTVCSIFDHVLARTPFFGKTSKKPTCHSLRHTFAVNSMRYSIRSGGNFDDHILYLCRYMGHSAPQETMYYLHLSVNVAQDIRKNAEGFEDVMGGVWHVEE
jgi:integrase